MARGPAYPYVDLETACDQLKKLYDFARRGPASIDAVAKEAWGWSPTSSTPSKAVAALKYFGLIDEVPGDSKQIKVSDRGYRILFDSLDSPERKKAIEAAALAPAQYAYVYKTWGVEVPPAARSTLLFEKGFVASTVDSFLRDYKATMLFSGLSGQPKQPDDEQKIDAIEPAKDDVESAEQVAQPIKRHNPGQAQPIRANSEGKTMRHDVFSVEEGSVTIEWPAELSIDSLTDIQDWLEIVKRKLARSLVTKQSGTDTGLPE